MSLAYRGPAISTSTQIVRAASEENCEREQFGSAQNVACKCDARHCDTRLEFHWPQDDSQIVRMTSDAEGARFRLDELLVNDLYDELYVERPRVERVVSVDINKRFQRIVGYGGAFTDSAAMLISSQLDNRTRRALMESYFGPAGLDYNLARIPIGGTDMSWRPYSYNDLSMRPENRTDFGLKSFHLQREDLDYKLPLIREANEIRRKSIPGACTNGRPDPAIKLLASSWSAPNWMKSNDNLVQGGLKDSLDGRYYDAYARYIIRFLDEYERELNRAPRPEVCKAPVRIWALTPQNEPCTPGRLGYQVVNYNSVNFEPKQMGHFIRLNLIPNLLQVNRTARDLALFIWDDTLLGFDKYKDHLFNALISDQQEIEADDEDEDETQLRLKMKMSHYDQYDKQLINDYVRGLALHWYSQALDKLPYKSLYDVRRWMPQRYSMISTEASFIGRPHLGEWARGEKYARDIIENFRSGSIGWIDWNLALNLEGGPTWSRNFLDAPILVDHHRKSVFYKNPMYYAIGHLSRFIRADSSIIESQIYINDHREEQTGSLIRSPSINSSSLSVDEQSLASVSQKDAGWRRVDEWEEQTSALLVVASELASSEQPEVAQFAPLKRRIALVLLNRAPERLRVKLNLANCKSPLGARPLNLELAARSITSLAFNC